ncbi:MAG: alpha/beta hydrolase [Bacteroidetes bacterium]|nr:MAG: alpha/beta hydrolase [Bacteroidota bacterium]
MAIIQFSHANGIPAATYQQLLQQLDPHQIQAIPAFGLGEYSAERGWAPLVQELIADIETHGQGPVIGLGHSLGAVLTLRAARLRPDLFSALILMDPPLFGWTKRLVIGMVRGLGLSGRAIPIARGAKRRRDHFASREEARAYWSQRSFFQRFHPQCFEDYLQAGLVEAPGGGFTLRIPTQVEYDIFRHTPVRIGRPPAGIPITLLVPETEGVSHPRETAALARRLRAEVRTLPGGHMFPVEQPDATARVLHELLPKN